MAENLQQLQVFQDELIKALVTSHQNQHKMAQTQVEINEWQQRVTLEFNLRHQQAVETEKSVHI